MCLKLVLAPSVSNHGMSGPVTKELLSNFHMCISLYGSVINIKAKEIPLQYCGLKSDPVSDRICCGSTLGIRRRLIPAELSTLTVRQLCISRVDGRRTCLNVKMTDEGQNLFQFQNDLRPQYVRVVLKTAHHR
jgi:hypothetical protein